MIKIDRRNFISFVYEPDIKSNVRYNVWWGSDRQVWVIHTYRLSTALGDLMQVEKEIRKVVEQR